MKLSEIYKTMVFDDRVFLDAKTLIMNIEELEAQIQDLIISEAKAIEMVNKMKCCENCKYPKTASVKCLLENDDYCWNYNYINWELKE